MMRAKNPNRLLAHAVPNLLYIWVANKLYNISFALVRVERICC